MTAPQPLEQGIESAGPYYQGWLSFTRWAKRGTVLVLAIVALVVIIIT